MVKHFSFENMQKENILHPTRWSGLLYLMKIIVKLFLHYKLNSKKSVVNEKIPRIFTRNVYSYVPVHNKILHGKCIIKTL
jgi:hypothetical protein